MNRPGSNVIEDHAPGLLLFFHKSHVALVRHTSRGGSHAAVARASINPRGLCKTDALYLDQHLISHPLK
jgi:hypothetical protein